MVDGRLLCYVMQIDAVEEVVEQDGSQYEGRGGRRTAAALEQAAGCPGQ
jgi:hypothetical protein